MRQTILLLATVGVALLFAGSVAFVLGFGPNALSAAQAQTTDQQPPVGESAPAGEATTPPEGTTAESAQQDISQADSGPGSMPNPTVSVTLPDRSRQVAPSARQRQIPPPLLTEEGQADVERSQQGRAPESNKESAEDSAASTEAAPSAESPQPSAPTLGTSFEGVTDTNTMPPDPTIAAGRNHVVAAVNGAVNIFKKNGTMAQSQTLQAFFSPLGTEHNDVFDPWLAYDPHIDRFWIIAVSGRTSTFNNVVVGVSRSNDVTEGWNLFEFDTTLNGSTDTSNWCDYPKLGFDAQAIYLTCNMFNDSDEFQYSKIRVMTKSQLVNNASTIRWWDFWDRTEGCFLFICDRSFTMQPAQMLGATASDGMYLVDSHGRGGDGDTLEVWRITNPQNCCTTTPSAPNIQQMSHDVGSYSPPPLADQLNSTTGIDAGDTRLLYAVWKGGQLFTGHSIAWNSGTDSRAGYYELNVSGYPSVSTLKDVAFGLDGFDYYYPAVAPNSGGNKTMVFSRSSSSEFAGTRYVGIDSSGNTDSSASLRAGQSVYNLNRWGDYLGASPDPDGTGVWVAGEFATATQDNWGVQVGLTHEGAPPIPSNDDFTSAQLFSGTSASVNGTNRHATREFSEPDHLPTSSALGSHSVWYRWTAPFSGTVTMDTCTKDFDTALAVYTGSTLGGLSRVASNDNACGSGSQVSFNAVSGTTYRIAVAGFSSASEGTFTLNFKMPPQNDNFANSQAINGGNATVNGTTLAATREASEADHYVTNPPDSDLWIGDHSVWYSWTAPFSGPVEINTCTANIDSILAVYTGGSLGALSRVVDNNNACPSGWGSKVTFNATNGTTYRIAVGDAGGLRENTFTLRLIERTPPKVTSTVPAATAKGVAPGANITATFSEAMDPKTLVTTPTDPANPNVGTSTTFKLMKAGTTTLIPAVVTYDPTTNKAILNPNANLRLGTKYKAAVTTEAKDLAGNQLDQDSSLSGLQQKGWSFTIRN